MAILDKINAVPTYTFTLPSTGKKVEFRPFLHKEEKALLMAKETGTRDDYFNTIKNLIKSCSFDKLDPDTMPSFDIEEFFIRVREKSIGETINMSLVCQQMNNDTGEICGHSNPIVINLADIKIDPKKIPKKDFDIKLNDNVSVQLNFPNFKTLEKILKIRMNNQLGEEEGENSQKEELDDVDVIATMVRSITVGDDVVEANSISIEEIKDFLNNLSSKQVEDLFGVVLKTPTIEYEVKQKCNKCTKEINYTFKGLYDFFV